jgi:hypothetical protein
MPCPLHSGAWPPVRWRERSSDNEPANRVLGGASEAEEDEGVEDEGDTLEKPAVWLWFPDDSVEWLRPFRDGYSLSYVEERSILEQVPCVRWPMSSSVLTPSSRDVCLPL